MSASPSTSPWQLSSPESARSTDSNQSGRHDGAALLSPSSNQLLSRSLVSPTSSTVAASELPQFPAPSPSPPPRTPSRTPNAASASSPHAAYAVLSPIGTKNLQVPAAIASRSSSGLATPMASSSAGSSTQSSTANSPSLGRISDAPTLAKRGASAASAASGAAKSGDMGRRRSPLPASLSRATDGFAGGEDDEDDLTITEEELSIEHFMRRNPCILDRGSEFLRRHAYLYPAAVIAATTVAVAAGSLAARAINASTTHQSVMYVGVLINAVLMAYAMRRPPGKPPQCPSEANVIQLLHGWPATSHHYGLHASEWARSWSFCQVCDSWRPARAHHCSTCNQCVLLMDHHCVWIGQCVGANNLRHFMAYVLSVLMLSVYGLWLSYAYIKDAAVAPTNSAIPADASLLLFGVLLLLSLLGSCMGGYLTLRCARLLLRNETGIEGLKKEQWRLQQRQVRRDKQHTPNPADQDEADQDKKRGRKQQKSVTAADRDDGANGSVFVARTDGDADGAGDAGGDDDAESGLLLSPDQGNTDPSRLRFFSPFQCACHRDSFRVLYCHSFNFPALRSSRTPIPPLPFYFDYAAGGGADLGLNASLFWDDLRRNESLHQWVQQGSRPIRAVGKHMFVPPAQTAKEQVEAAAAAAGAAGAAHPTPALTLAAL